MSAKTPYSEEVHEHLLRTARLHREERADLRAVGREARGELLKTYRGLVGAVIASYTGLLPQEQLEVSAEFAFFRAVDGYEGEAAEGVSFPRLAEEWMRQEIEDTLRHQRHFR